MLDKRARWQSIRAALGRAGSRSEIEQTRTDGYRAAASRSFGPGILALPLAQVEQIVRQWRVEIVGDPVALPFENSELARLCRPGRHQASDRPAVAGDHDLLARI